MMPLQGEDGSAEAGGLRLAEALGTKSVAEMRSKTAEEIYEALADAPGLQLVGNADGYVFPKDIYDIFAEGSQNDVDTIVGFNSDEGTALFAGAVPEDVAGYREWLETSYPGHADQFFEVYPASDDEQANVAGYENMGRPLLRLADARLGRAAVGDRHQAGAQVLLHARAALGTKPRPSARTTPRRSSTPSTTRL